MAVAQAALDSRSARSRSFGGAPGRLFQVHIHVGMTRRQQVVGRSCRSLTASHITAIIAKTEIGEGGRSSCRSWLSSRRASDDAEVFADLHRSVLAFTPPGTAHRVYVPFRNRGRFAACGGPRCRIRDRSRLLPPRNVSAPLTDVHVNVRRPWPPLRGWVMQQTSKIAAAGQSDATCAVGRLGCRPSPTGRSAAAHHWRPGCLCREDGGVTASMKRHVIWHRAARELLELPPAPPPPLPDYV